MHVWGFTGLLKIPPKNPRRTKRQILQESMSWDEKADGKKSLEEKFDDWSMMGEGS